jgi:hypothetical protein
LYSGNVRFESWHGHHLPSLRFFVILLSSSKSQPNTSKCFKNSLTINHHINQCYSMGC